MKLRPVFLSCFLLALGSLSAMAAGPELAESKKKPDGLSKGIGAQLAATGHTIKGDDGLICEIWLAKDIEAKPGFKPTLSVKYPFMPGQLVGALQIGKVGQFTDFRGQELNSGVYTLRYAQQPVDGNHIGTSQLADFLLAVPAAEDTDPKPVTSGQILAQKSAKSAGTSHPAIFSLLPVEKPVEAATLAHEEDHDFWILSVNASTKQKDKTKTVPMRIVAIGRSPE